MAYHVIIEEDTVSKKMNMHLITNFVNVYTLATVQAWYGGHNNALKWII